MRARGAVCRVHLFPLASLTSWYSGSTAATDCSTELPKQRFDFPGFEAPLGRHPSIGCAVAGFIAAAVLLGTLLALAAAGRGGAIRGLCCSKVPVVLDVPHTTRWLVDRRLPAMGVVEPRERTGRVCVRKGRNDLRGCDASKGAVWRDCEQIKVSLRHL